MAAGDSSAVSPYVSVLVAMLPAILSPIVVWVLGRSRISKQAATIDYLNKRLDIIERLSKLRVQLTEDPIKPFLDAEIEYSRAFLHEPPAFVQRGEVVKVAGSHTIWDRFFLTEPAVSRRKRIFKGLFYFFFAFAIMGLLGAIFAFFEPNVLGPDLITPYLFGCVFYLVLALLCRRAAR